MTNMNTPEVSPAESFMSIPGQPYPSLFQPFTPPSSGTVNPMDMLTPSSCYDDSRVAGSSPTPEAEIPASTPVSASASADAHDVKQEDGDDKPKQKKPAKKRKSWGQVLPEPKTNLPPRKRAKTEDEKEQRRVERVLRNRRAAQSSRERKRQEVENLEKVNTELMAKVVAYEKNQAVLLEEIRRLQQEAGANAGFSRIQSVLQETSLSFSQKLFDSKCEQPKHEPAAQSAAPSTGQSAAAPLGDILATHKPFTVNPSTISPQLTPILEEAEPPYSADQPDLSQLAKAQDATLPEQPPTTSPDLTHPAVSSIGGGAASVPVPSVANLDSASLGLAAATPHDAAYSLGGSYGQFPTAPDQALLSDHMPIDEGALSDFINLDYLAGDVPCPIGTDTFGQSDFPLFDTYLNEDTSFFDNAAASADIAASNAVDLGFSHSEN